MPNNAALAADASTLRSSIGEHMDPCQINHLMLGGVVRSAPFEEQFRGRPKWSFTLEHHRQVGTGTEVWTILVDVWFERLFPIVSRLADGDHVLIHGELRPMGGQQGQRRPTLKINAEKIMGDAASDGPRRVLDFSDRLPEATHSREDPGGI
jgi:hypothetical protein